MLLEKKGKSTEYLNNLSPITLTNCDLKIITKTFANRMSKVLEEIIHESKTAYIPGRYVYDNQRSLELIIFQWFFRSLATEFLELLRVLGTGAFFCLVTYLLPMVGR